MAPSRADHRRNFMLMSAIASGLDECDDTRRHCQIVILLKAEEEETAREPVIIMAVGHKNCDARL